MGSSMHSPPVLVHPTSLLSPRESSLGTEQASRVWGLFVCLFVLGFFVFFSSLRFNSPTIHFILLKCASQRFLVYSENCATITTASFQSMLSPQRNPVPICCQSPPLPASGNHYSTTVCLCGCSYSGHFREMESCISWLSGTVFLHLCHV